MLQGNATNYVHAFLSLEPPVFTNKPSPQVIVVRGSTLNLCCEATGSPRPSIEWLRAQQSSDSPLAFQENGCLKINTAKENSEGEYICRATNQFGQAETSTAVGIVNFIGCEFHITFLFLFFTGLLF